MANAVATQEQKQGITSFLSIPAVREQINNVVGQRSQTFITSVVSAVNANPALAECTNQSIFSGALLGESLNLSPSPQLGSFYLVPYKNTKTGQTEAQFQMGYKGYVQLAIRSGQYKKLNVLPIKQGELINFDPLNEEIEVNLIEDEVQREKTPTIGYYAMFEYTNGFRKAIYWSKEKMENHAEKYSKGYKAHKGYTFWEKDFDAMACKTMIRQLLSKWGIMSIEMQTAFEKDHAVLRDGKDSKPDYVDNYQDPIEVRDADVSENANAQEFVDADVVEVTEDADGQGTIK